MHFNQTSGETAKGPIGNCWSERIGRYARFAAGKFTMSLMTGCFEDYSLFK